MTAENTLADGLDPSLEPGRADLSSAALGRCAPLRAPASPHGRLLPQRSRAIVDALNAAGPIPRRSNRTPAAGRSQREFRSGVSLWRP